MSELRDPDDSGRHPPSSSSFSTDSDDLLDEETEDDELPHLMDAADAEAEAESESIPGAAFVHAPAQPPPESNNSVAVSCTENKPETEVVDFPPPSPNFLEGEGEESGTEEDRYRFVKELHRFYRERGMDFRPPKFYGEILNLLKLWRAVARLGGYERVTSCKLWRQVGEGFKPPKTCTTVSWTFRVFYEKAILEYEKHKIRTGEFQVPASSLGKTVVNDKKMNVNLLSGSGRARRDAAARAMQGWHSQRLLDNDEDEYKYPIIKDKNSVSIYKRDKSYGGKRKRPSRLEGSYNAPRTNFARTQDDSMVVDVGEPAEWVKVNVRRTKDCYEVYVLVPGLLREEVHVQSDPCGRLIISGEPEQLDNPWGVAPFKKVVTLPSRIDPHQTSAVVTPHGQLFVRAPFEQDL